MYALVCPNEEKSDWKNEVKGMRIAEVTDTPFVVAEPYYWMECGPEVNTEFWCVITNSNNQGELVELAPLPPMPTEPLVANNSGSPQVVAI